MAKMSIHHVPDTKCNLLDLTPTPGSRFFPIVEQGKLRLKD